MDDLKNFTPLKNLKPKKKVNKWLIYGNLFLAILIAVIGVVYYNDVLIATKQKAGFECSDWSNPRKCREERKKYEESGQAEADKEAKKKKEQEERRMKKEAYVPPGGCPNGYTQCEVIDTRGNKNQFCIANDGSEGGCNQGAVNRGITVKIGGDGPGAGGWLCQYGKNGYSGGICVGYNSVKEIGQGKPPSCFCGIIQIDGGPWAGTYQSTCGCKKDEEEKIRTNIIGTIIPTPTNEIPTNTPTATPTRTPTNTPTLTSILTPTLTPTTPISQPTSTPINTPESTSTPIITNTPTPTEIILAQVTSTPTSSQPTNTPPPPVTADQRPKFIYLIPLLLIGLGLLL